MIELASYIGTINWRWKMDVSLAIKPVRPLVALEKCHELFGHRIGVGMKGSAASRIPSFLAQ